MTMTRVLCVLVALAAFSGAVEAQSPPTGGHQHQEPADGRAADEPSTPIPPVTDADLAAAFPDVDPHPMAEDALNSFLLLDQLEGVDTPSGPGLSWDAMAWVGGDLNRVWFRTEGEAEDGRLGETEAHLLYGRAIARWWDVVVGVRQDVRPGPSRSWLAVGLQGLAPYWFEIEATAYVGAGGRTAARLEAEYDLLITNRLVLQPLVEVNLQGRDDQVRGIGVGGNDVETGLRLRYVIRREFAPYVGVVWTRRFGDPVGVANMTDDAIGGTRVVAGVRLWY
jgi:copper resistance protein B